MKSARRSSNWLRLVIVLIALIVAIRGEIVVIQGNTESQSDSVDTLVSFSSEQASNVEEIVIAEVPVVSNTNEISSESVQEINNSIVIEESSESRTENKNFVTNTSPDIASDELNEAIIEDSQSISENQAILDDSNANPLQSQVIENEVTVDQIESLKHEETVVDQLVQSDETRENEEEISNDSVLQEVLSEEIEIVEEIKEDIIVETIAENTNPKQSKKPVEVEKRPESSIGKKSMLFSRKSDRVTNVEAVKDKKGPSVLGRMKDSKVTESLEEELFGSLYDVDVDVDVGNDANGGESRPRRVMTKKELYSLPRSVAYPVERVIAIYANAKSTLYDVLGVSNTADDMEIKRVYRSMALKIHPDKNVHPDAFEAMAYLREAYGILSTKKDRQTYDNTLKRKLLKKKNFAKNFSKSLKNTMVNFNARSKLFVHNVRNGKLSSEISLITNRFSDMKIAIFDVFEHLKYLPTISDKWKFFCEVLLRNKYKLLLMVVLLGVKSDIRELSNLMKSMFENGK